MKPVIVLYATCEGHTEAIANYIGRRLSSAGLSVDVQSVSDTPATLVLDNYSGAILAASVHRQKHEKTMIRFVQKNEAQLSAIPACFLSVSLSQAGAEDESAPPAKREAAAYDAQHMINMFLADTGWLPMKTKAVAGALLYSRYNWLMRRIMRRIARQAGGGTDTSRDYIYTKWDELDRFVDEFLTCIGRTAPAARRASA